MTNEKTANNKNVSARIKKIVSGIKEKTAVTAYKLTVKVGSKPDIFSSKFGGVPYWDMTREYPMDENGNKMMLLAQVNFTKAALRDERLPEQGMLQFFIANEDDVYGLDFDDPQSQKNFRVVYHETIDGTVTGEEVRALQIPISTEDGEEYSPVFQEVEVEISKVTTYLGTEDWRFDRVYQQVVKEQEDGDTPKANCNQSLSEDDGNYLYDELCNMGHWILGYPYFTQSDPREDMDEETGDYYDTLLFQMDSEMIDKEDYVLWGDCGVANFFINSQALKEKDFSRVLYNWDCC